MKCYDWATEQRKSDNCVMSGFHSKIEKDVLHFLLKGKQPLILVLGRSLYKKIPEEFIKPLEDRLSELGIPYKIFGRPKSIYSIFNKIKKKQK